MMLLRVAVLLLLVCGLWDTATASVGSEGAIDCCLATSNTRIPVRIVKTYAVQTTDGGCKIDATLIITKAGKKLCAPPASKQKWVRDIIKKVNKSERVGKGRSKGGKRKGKNGKKRH